VPWVCAVAPGRLPGALTFLKALAWVNLVHDDELESSGWGQVNWSGAGFWGIQVHGQGALPALGENQQAPATLEVRQA